MADEVLDLIIRDRENVLFEGPARALSSQSDKGVFDILPQHTNFISIVKEKVIIHKIDGSSQDIAVRYGIVKVYMNKVSVYLGILPEAVE
jgi:F0F1-type ATP synthase epsilon subunit